MSVPDYMRSYEALRELSKRVNLIKIFNRPGADFFSKLNDESPDPEILLKYYRKQVAVVRDSDTGLIHLDIRTFRPADSLLIGNVLLELGERKINEMNQRSYDDAIKAAQAQLRRAEDSAADTQRNITEFRQTHLDVDPELSGQAQIKLVAELNTRIASARAQLTAMSTVISHDGPQYLALLQQIDSLQSETNKQMRTMGGQNTAMAGKLGQYEALKVQQDFAAKNYEAAAANLQRAIEQAQKQQLYFVRVINPNLPVRALYPKRAENVLTLTLFLLVGYGIGWLILAGVREHAA